MKAVLDNNDLDLGILIVDSNEHHNGEMLLYDPTLWVMADSTNTELPATAPLPLIRRHFSA